MGKNERLIDQLQTNLSKLDDKQKEAFRQSLKRQLPSLIRRAAEEAKQATQQEDQKR